MSETLLIQIGFAAAIAVAVFAFLKGDEPERIGAGAFVMALFSSLLLRDSGGPDQIQWPQLIIDAVMVVLYGALAWKSHRAWPAWAAALQLVAVMGHVLMLTDLRPPLSAVQGLGALVGATILAILALAVAQAWRDRGRAAFE